MSPAWGIPAHTSTGLVSLRHQNKTSPVNIHSDHSPEQGKGQSPLQGLGWVQEIQQNHALSCRLQCLPLPAAAQPQDGHRALHTLLKHWRNPTATFAAWLKHLILSQPHYTEMFQVVDHPLSLPWLSLRLQSQHRQSPPWERTSNIPADTDPGNQAHPDHTTRGHANLTA